MRPHKIIARILLILPIIDFAFALPMAVQETRQVSGDVVLDVTITMSAKRADETEKGMYFERLSGKPDSDLAGLKALQPEAPDHGSMDSPQTGTSEIQQPELFKSPSFDHYLESPGSDASDASLNHYLWPPVSDGYDASAGEYSTDSESDSSLSAPSGSGRSTMSLLMEKSKSFLSKVASKLRLWRRTSGPGSGRDAVSAARRELQGLVDTGAHVSASSPESQTF
jgi:hypothetical protein